MGKPGYIELFEERIPILYEDRAILAIDKPPGWMLVPVSWQNTGRNLQAALLSSMAAGHHWARSRNLKFLRYIHRLDAGTSGVMLFARSIGALKTFERLFETRKMEKVYLAVTNRKPKEESWNCRLSLGPDPKQIGRMIADPKGKPAETEFRLVGREKGKYLIEGRPYTGRTHQVRIHLTESGCPIIGDELYGQSGGDFMALRAVGLAFKNPFTRKPVAIRAPVAWFLKKHGFSPETYQVGFRDEP
jgi:RluA family pseudouridine synthase